MIGGELMSGPQERTTTQFYSKAAHVETKRRGSMGQCASKRFNAKD
jgi:hypothetical protein